MGIEVKLVFEDENHYSNNKRTVKTNLKQGNLVHKAVYDALYNKENQIPWISNGSIKGTNPIPNSYDITKIITDGVKENPNYRFDKIKGPTFNTQNKIYTDRVIGNEMIVHIKYHSPAAKR